MKKLGKGQTQVTCQKNFKFGSKPNTIKTIKKGRKK
jgi:hypothetical protein